LSAAGYELTTHLDAVKNEWVYTSIIPYVFMFCCLAKHRSSCIDLFILCLQHLEGDAVLQIVPKFQFKDDSPFIRAVKILYYYYYYHHHHHHHHQVFINNNFLVVSLFETLDWEKYC